ncbi:phenylacetate--CoA ligase family protein [Pelotomaculum propionicicum]|uniref:Phenylacetate-coenzyme A ligase n=1 Tax=Pelotomaculum propionicicum TaxID=258475 RepID=A0A4Y7RKZ1_9FIRM|nr:phenylacetate--CoA ligase [Pelotomaculum propionicicum]NLI11520.1 phenylacetate--CoA ligase [Peptococcaceae bacterium]TEB09658.1 Phenylacetate-coenzyme A ligase [Pelotomaculum propionicicum]
MIQSPGKKLREGYFDPEHETMSRDELAQLQLERLQATVKKVYRSVPFYKKALKARGVEPGDIKSLDDIKKLPFTYKQDLRDNYPYGLFAAPMDKIIRLHASSGTTGKPSVVGYTKKDIYNWAGLIARCLVMAGGGKDDVVQVAYGYGLFTGGLGAHYGAERLGAAVVPISGGNTARQLMLMQDFGSTILACTPSYALFLAEEGLAAGVDFRKLPIRAGVFGAEPWSENMRRQIESKMDITALDIYGLSEVMGPGVSMECPAKQGSHIFEDHFIAEIIDPDTGDVLPYGQRGELVLTTITKEGIPLLRYRTRDISTLHPEVCACGRTHVRMKRVTGRTDDMLIIRGVNVFPSQVESVLLEFGETEPHYLLVVDRKGDLDELEIRVELSEKMFSDEVRQLEKLENRIRHKILSVLNINARIRFVEPRTIPRSEGKAKRVMDRREL